MTLLFRRKYFSIGTQPEHNLGLENAIQMDAVGIFSFRAASSRLAKFQNISKTFFHPLFQEKSLFWRNSGAVATITQPINILLSRNTAGFISDNNSWWIFSEVKK